MNRLNAGLAILLLSVTSVAGAGDDDHDHDERDYKQHDYTPRHDLFDYAKVVRAEPIYRQVRVSEPVRDCRQVPVYHTRSHSSKSASGMLAGGLLGGIIGHQVGKGRDKRVATAVGTLIGAQIGHEAVNGHGDAGHRSREIVGYEKHCETHQEVRYEEVLDGYDVTYKYRGRHYNIVMPYDPGKRIKMRIQITPVI